MKVFNYISAFLLAGAAIVVSCSQNEEMEGMESSQNFQINVFDGGYQNIDAVGTRAAEKDYSTEFVTGDAIGVFAVKNGTVVEDINNRRFVMDDGIWELNDDGEVISYKANEFERMKFYAYYPYSEDATFDPSKEDPFETYVKNWKIGNDQNENYTKYDLMTSKGEVQGDRLKGKIAFTMQHRMALAVIQMPEIVYSFTNEPAIDDYKLPVAVGDFNVDGASAKPFYQKSTDAYRFLVKPSTEFTITGSYTGVKEMDYEIKKTLEGGTAKKYVIEDPNKISHLLAVGDYYCADGKIVSASESAPANAIGVVFYAGNPQPSVTHPEKYTIDKDPLRRDCPECKHGLVLALNNGKIKGTDENETLVETARFSTANKLYYGTWFRADEDYKDAYVDMVRQKVAPTAGSQGYNNTVLMEVGANRTDDSKKASGNALEALDYYRSAVSVPTVSTKWFFPSDYDLITLHDVVTKVNTSIGNTDGTQLVINDGDTKNGTFYWSNTERNEEWMWGNTMGSGNDTYSPSGSGSLTAKRYASGYEGYFRMMLAF